MQAKESERLGGRKTLPALVRTNTVPGPHSPGGKRNPTEECNHRRDLEIKFETRMQELLDEKMRLNKRFSGATSKEYKLQKRIRDKKSTLMVLKDQDNINQRRQEMMEKCADEQQILADTNMQIAIQTNYAKTLNLMKDRLWLKQTTFQKTMKAYYKTLEAQKAEVADVTKMRENASLKLTKAHERNRLFKKKAAEHLEFLQRQLDGLRYMDRQHELMEQQKRDREEARLRGLQEKENAEMQNDITGQMQEDIERRKQAELLEEMQDHEEAFRKIQMASGLESSDEIVDAFNNRDAYLSDVVRKVDMLRRQLNEAQKRHNQLKAALVNELVESDSAAAPSTDSNSIVADIVGSNKEVSDDLSTELLQQQKTRLQRALRDQAKMRNYIIKFAQAIEGVFDSVASLKDANLTVDALMAASDPEPAPAPAPSGGRVRSRPNSRTSSRPASSRTSSRPGSSRNYGSQRSRTGTPKRREKAASFLTPSMTAPEVSILKADHLTKRISTIDRTATELTKQILALREVYAANEARSRTQDARDAEEPAEESKEANEEEKEGSDSAAPAAAPAPAAEAAAEEDESDILGPHYEEKLADFMWVQKFPVRNNIRVKSLPVPGQEENDQRSPGGGFDGRGSEGELLDLDDGDEALFDRDSIKKVSITLINKNTRRQKKRGGSKKDDSKRSPAASKRKGSPSPRRASNFRSSAPGDN